MPSGANLEFQPTFLQALRRGFRLRCPRCGLGRLTKGLLGMRRECTYCELDYVREPGYYVGAMIINYGITVALIIGAYLISGLIPVYWHASSDRKILAWIAASIVISLCLVPLCRSLWLAVDYWVEPWDSRNEAK
jgi:uncharacterized protein (DUF983 family)